MKKRYIVSALGIGLAGYVIGANMNRNNRNGKESIEIAEDLTFYNAGKPDQVESLELDQIENAKMVSEGSQFGVQYYNNMKEQE